MVGDGPNERLTGEFFNQHGNERGPHGHGQTGQHAPRGRRPSGLTPEQLALGAPLNIRYFFCPGTNQRKTGLTH